MRRIIPIISLLLFFVGATFGQTMVSIPDATAPDGSDVLIPVSIGTLNDVGSVNLNIQFDASVVTFQSVENNVLTGNFVVNASDSVIQIGWFGLSPVDLSGKMFDLKFAYTSGTSALAFVGVNEIADQVGGAYPVTFVDGSIGPEPATMKLNTAFGIPGATIVVELSASNLQNVGAMNIYIDYDDTVVEYLGLGDVNLPGFTTGTTAGTINLGMFNAGGFDHVSGLLAELKFEVISGTEDLVFDQVKSVVEKTDFTVVPIVYTDGRAGETDPAFVLGDAEGTIGMEVSVPFNGLLLENIGAFNVDIEFDSDVLEFVGVENTVSGALTGNETTAGVLSLGYFNALGLNVTDGKIADLVFNYSGGETDVTWDAASADIQDLTFNPVTVAFLDGSVTESEELPVLYEFADSANGGTLDQDWVFQKWAGDGGNNIYVADSTAGSIGSHVIVYEDSGYTGMAHVRELALTNYTISADIYLVGETDPDFPLYTGIGIRMANDEGKYYRLIFRNSSTDMGQVKLQGYDGAAWHISKAWNPDVDFPALATGWHNFKVKVEDATFWCYLDGVLLPDSPQTDAEPFLELGYAGVYKYNTGFGKVVFDNFTVQSPELPPAQKAVSISAIQQGQAASGQYTDQAVQITGTVSAIKGSSYFLQSGKGAWSGINVYNSGNGLVLGDSVTQTGFIYEYFDKTEMIDVVSLEVHSTGHTVEPVVLSTAAVNMEEYESVLVGIMDAVVTKENNSFGEWEVDDGTGPVVIDDWLTKWTPAFGEHYVIFGVTDYTFGASKILPRDSSEIVLIGIDDLPDTTLMMIDHNAGGLIVTAYNTGVIGDYGALRGTGIEWNGYNGIWRGSLVYGTAGKASVNGVAHNNGGVGFDDLVNVESYFNVGFDADDNFDQVLNAQISDSNATEPYAGIDVIQTTFSDSAAGAGVYYQYTFVNNTGAALTDLYAGMYLDLDVGSYTANSGGIAESEHLAYVYEPGSTNPYFGVAACNGLSGAKAAGTNAADEATLRGQGFTYISTPDGTAPTADMRLWVGSKVPDMADGASESVIFAIVAGDDLIGIRENAQAAVNHIIALGMSGLDPVGVDVVGNLIPEDFEIAQNYPNPFNPSTTIKYGLPAASQVKITIYNTLGEIIDVLVNRDQAAGYYEVNWNASKLASGVYLYSIEATSAGAGKDFAIVKKMMLLK